MCVDMLALAYGQLRIREAFNQLTSVEECCLSS